jgi:hypothetical protein
MEFSTERMGHKEWMRRLRIDVEEAGFDNPFMLVLRWIEENTWQFMGDQDDIPKYRNFGKKVTTLALENSVRYLMDIGYLSRDGDNRNPSEWPAIFSRSSF